MRAFLAHLSNFLSSVKRLFSNAENMKPIMHEIAYSHDPKIRVAGDKDCHVKLLSYYHTE